MRVVVRRAVGGTATMAAQLARLAELNERPNVSIRVMPFSLGAHPGLDSGPFILMRFATTGDGRSREPPTVYVQGFTGALYLDKPRETSRSNSEQACVEVAQSPTAVGVRDSKNPQGGHLALTPTAFNVLLHRVKTGDLDL